MSVLHAKHVCQIVKLKPSAVDEYIKIHTNAWPGILAALERVHILLTAHFKYTGQDYHIDMKKIGDDPETQRWWNMYITNGMQESLVEGAKGSGKDVPWWTDLPEVFSFPPFMGGAFLY